MANRKRLLQDEAFGFTILSSLERKEGDNYFKADILTQPLAISSAPFVTDDPVEALARSLNDKGKVDVTFISSALRLTVDEAVNALGDHIYINPVTNEWENGG